MPDWSSLKRRAQQIHQQLREVGGQDAAGLLPAETLLSAASEMTGLDYYAAPSHDPLLSQAHAVLDREKEVIWYAAELPTSRRWLILAHEFAHYFLHPELTGDLCHEADVPEEFTPTGQGSHSAQIATGYSPAERREIEANLFAVELLLPAPLLRRTFATEGRSAADIAAQVGVSEACVLSQLAQSLPNPPAPFPDSLLRRREGGDIDFPAVSLPPAIDGSSPQSQLSPFPVSAANESGKGAGGLGTLDPSQRIAAEIERGPVLVDAGPGTGKTRTLVARLCHLIQTQGVAADNILALTFSNKAAEEMRSRLRDAIGETADRVWIGTFHAFGFELLRKDGQRIGLPSSPLLLETADAILLLQEQIDRLPLDNYLYLSNPGYAFPDILRCISRAKDELQAPEEYLQAARRQLSMNDDATGAKAVEVADIYAMYEELLRERGLLDFGDLLMRPVQLLDACPDVLARWQAQFPHILADEYQDINRASAELLKRLVGGGRGFWAVGDLRQAIYRFRGASPANVREFERDFPGGQRLRLAVNYRTRASIVGLFAASAALMDGVESDSKPAWEAHRSDTHEPVITLAIADDTNAQADGLAASIRAWQSAGVGLREQAILCRTNRQAGELAGLLEQRGVPVQHLGSLFERDEIKDLLALLAFTCEPYGASLARVAHFADYAIPDADVTILREAARTAHTPFPAALALADDLPKLSQEGRAGLRRLRHDLQNITYRGDAWFRLSRYLFGGSAYLRPLIADDSFAAQQKCLAIQRLLSFAQGVGLKQKDIEEQDKPAAFLAYLRHLLSCGEERSIRVAESAEGLPAVRMMTAHSSKGLEFPVVYLPTLIKGQFPVRKQSGMAALPPFLQSDGTPADVEPDTDESLFFVALSRARDHLVLSYPKKQKGRSCEPSPYLAALLTTLENTNAQRVEWHTATPETEAAEQDTVPVSGERPTVSLAAIEQYQECPRQFYYQRVARLETGDEEPATRLFYTTVQETLTWLSEEQEAGNAPATEDVKEQFTRFWKRSAPEEDNGMLRLMQSQGEALITAVGANLPPAESATPQMELTADLPNGTVRLKCDRAVPQPDGSLRLERQIKRELKSDDHLKPRLALMRHAAKQQDASRPAEIALVSLTTGETKVVPEKASLEAARVKKYDDALAGIRAEKFPAAPDDKRCPNCPYYFLCPA